MFLTVLTIVTMVRRSRCSTTSSSGARPREKAARYPLAAGQARAAAAAAAPAELSVRRPASDLRREEERLLDHYEWVDKNAGIVRMPIERAIDVLAAKGLPYRHEGDAAASKLVRMCRSRSS